jgi:hypothetical protein
MCFDAEEGWGVIEAPEVPCGCFVHFAGIQVTGYRELRADLPRTRSTTVAAVKTSGAATAPAHTAMSGAPGLGRISVPGGGGGGLKRSDFVM